MTAVFEIAPHPLPLLPNRRATVTLESQKWAAEVADEVLLKRRVVIVTAVSLVTELQNVAKPGISRILKAG